MDYLRKRFASLLPRKHPSELLKEEAEPMPKLIAKYRQTEDEEKKAALLSKIYAQFPRTLFLASVCYPEDDPTQPVYDRTLHGSKGSKDLFEENQPVVMNGNPGYKLGKKDTGKEMHLRMLVGKSSGQSWIPLFTDFTKYTPYFGIKTRVALFTLREVKAMCQPGQGILIDPGENALPLTAEDLRKIK